VELNQNVVNRGSGLLTHNSKTRVPPDSQPSNNACQRCEIQLLFSANLQVLDDRVLELWLGGVSHEFRQQGVRAWARGGQAPVAEGQVVSPMPGRVTKVLKYSVRGPENSHLTDFFVFVTVTLDLLAV